MGQDFLINATGSGDATLVAAPGPNLFIRVLHYHLTSDRPVVTLLKSGSTTKDIIYATAASGGGISTPEEGGDGIFDCAVNEALVINLSTTANVGGAGRYTVKGKPPG